MHNEPRGLVPLIEPRAGLLHAKGRVNTEFQKTTRPPYQKPLLQQEESTSLQEHAAQPVGPAHASRGLRLRSDQWKHGRSHQEAKLGLHIGSRSESWL